MLMQFRVFVSLKICAGKFHYKCFKFTEPTPHPVLLSLCVPPVDHVRKNEEREERKELSVGFTQSPEFIH